MSDIFFIHVFIDLQRFLFLIKEKSLGYSIHILPGGLAIFIYHIFLVDYLEFLSFFNWSLCWKILWIQMSLMQLKERTRKWWNVFALRILYQVLLMRLTKLLFFWDLIDLFKLLELINLVLWVLMNKPLLYFRVRKHRVLDLWQFWVPESFPQSFAISWFAILFHCCWCICSSCLNVEIDSFDQVWILLVGC